MADNIEPRDKPLPDAVARLVIGLVDPSTLNSPIRKPTTGEKTKYLQTHWNNYPGDNFSGLPVFFEVPQSPDPSNDFSLQIPFRTPPNSLTYAQFRDAVRCIVLEDKNLTGGACWMVAINEAGSTALLVDLMGSLNVNTDTVLGGAIYWPNALNPPFSPTGGPFSSTNVLQMVAPTGVEPTPPAKTTWQGFYRSRAAHGKAQGVGIFNGKHYLFMDGSPWAEPGSLQGMQPAGGSTHQYQGIQGYICKTIGDAAVPNGPTGGMWLTQAILDAGLANPVQAPVNYDEVIYLTAGCIIFCVPPQLPASSTLIIPAGAGPNVVYFKVKIWEWSQGAEKLINLSSPVGQILPNMQPSDPYYIWPIHKPGYYRWEFTLIATGPGVNPGTYAYSVILSSLGEFWGHHMLPGLVSNNTKATLIDGAIATINFDASSVNDNVATFAQGPPTGIPTTSSALDRAIYSSTAANEVNIRIASVLASTVTINNNTGSTLGKSSDTVLPLPTGMDWMTALEVPSAEDNLQLPPNAFTADRGSASKYYTNPYVNLDMLSRHAQERDLTDKHFNWLPPGGAQAFWPKPNIRTTRRAQIKLLRSMANLTQVSDYKQTLLAQALFEFPLQHSRATMGTIMASPSSALYVPASSLIAAVTSSIPFDFRLRFEISAEITTDNMWNFGEVMTSTTTSDEWEQAVYIVSQLPISETGDNYLDKIFSRLPPVWKTQLLTYLKKDIEVKPYAIRK